MAPTFPYQASMPRAQAAQAAVEINAHLTTRGPIALNSAPAADWGVRTVRAAKGLNRWGIQADFHGGYQERVSWTWLNDTSLAIISAAMRAPVDPAPIVVTRVDRTHADYDRLEYSCGHSERFNGTGERGAGYFVQVGHRAACLECDTPHYCGMRGECRRAQEARPVVDSSELGLEGIASPAGQPAPDGPLPLAAPAACVYCAQPVAVGFSALCEQHLAMCIPCMHHHARDEAQHVDCVQVDCYCLDCHTAETTKRASLGAYRSALTQAQRQADANLAKLQADPTDELARSLFSTYTGERNSLACKLFNQYGLLWRDGAMVPPVTGAAPVTCGRCGDGSACAIPCYCICHETDDPEPPLTHAAREAAQPCAGCGHPFEYHNAAGCYKYTGPGEPAAIRSLSA